MGDPARAQAKPSTDGPRNAAHHRRGRRQLNATGTVTAEFIYANGINVPDAILSGGKTYALLRDHLGSVRLVVDVQTGAIAQQLAYDAFGQVTQDTNPGFQPFGFAGGLYDANTGLVHFGAREYDASIGRWISKDPIGFDGGGQANIYVYVGNNPANGLDPFGLTVYACQAYENDWSHYWWIYHGFSHAFLRTDSNTFGLYPSGRFGAPATIVDDSGSDATCREVRDVDEDCVNGYARYAAKWGPYGLSNNCGTFVAEVLNACRRSPPMPFNGGEGAPGSWSPNPYPPGGF